MDVAALDRPHEFIGKLWLPDKVRNERLVEEDKWRTLSDFRVGLPDGRLIFIERGFVYNKGSVPRFAQWYLRRDEAKAEKGFLTHDSLYLIQGIVGERITRKEADDIMCMIHKAEGLRWDKRVVAYLGVRSGGGLAWRNHSKNLE